MLTRLDHDPDRDKLAGRDADLRGVHPDLRDDFGLVLSESVVAHFHSGHGGDV